MTAGKEFLLSALIMLGILSESHAQSWPQQSWWSFSNARFNPAVAANAYSLSATGFLRRQWNNLPGAPNTMGLTLAAPIYRVNGGASLAIERDRLGIYEITQVKSALSLAVIKRDNFRLSVGAGANFRQARLNGDDLRTDNGVYTNGGINHVDNFLPINGLSATTFGLDIGLAAKLKETEFGVSLLDVNNPISNYQTIDRPWPRTILGFVTTTLPIGEVLDLQLGAIVQNDSRLTQTQVSALGWYNRNIGAGFAFRGFGNTTIDAASLLLAWKASPLLTFAYAYDFGLSELSTAHDGSHEICVRYAMSTPIGKGRLPPIIFNPRL